MPAITIISFKYILAIVEYSIPSISLDVLQVLLALIVILAYIALPLPLSLPLFLVDINSSTLVSTSNGDSKNTGLLSSSSSLESRIIFGLGYIGPLPRLSTSSLVSLPSRRRFVLKLQPVLSRLSITNRYLSILDQPSFQAI